MPSTSTKKSTLQYLGLALFAVALLIFTAMPGIDDYQLTEEALLGPFESELHQEALRMAASQTGVLDQAYETTFGLERALKQTYSNAQFIINRDIDENGVPEGKQRWEVELPDWKFKSEITNWTKTASVGPVVSNPWMWFLLTIGLGALGGLLYIIPKFSAPAGIKHDHIYHNQLTKGLDLSWRTFFVTATVIGVLAYGVSYMDDSYFWPAVTAGIAVLILLLVLIVQRSWGREPRDAGPEGISGYLGIFFGIYLIGFYVLLYWASHHIVAWVHMVDPISRMLSGNGASQWFLYGLMYTFIILVMGVRMISKYRHNKYQMLRTGSVMFFQTAFAFLIPEILVALNKPWYDFKNIWPLDYDFFFGWQLDQFQSAGAVGLFMLFWGILLVIVGVPLMVHLVGKRWYCSWVCGCGGLAETMGDPFRQLSDKSLRAWKFERWIIHGVLVAAVVMTGMTLYSYFGGSSQVLGFETGKVQKWYGFLIGAGFAGVVGTGFYPLMGNRVWCRFGCPLAAYLGLVQRFQSRFRITTNGGQCISCGNCSTYCEMGIDVRHYAQRGQDIVRASCVGCGVCAAVCPRGVLRLENSSEDISERAAAERVIHIREGEEVGIL
ncbi:4Fe-4S dicluster domain-containing protein [Lewinella sp. W8]|uniref:4Fe-4S binding protein n=1 Tax=Lewinella sp. W8 TaxID=2528208 RepID=UPI0020A63CD1|nr:4Fe-4S dicluster domain-containing protein [Lewinella sp. W8]